MNEKDLNRIITKSIHSIGWCHKISDDAGNFLSTSKKPFDYFGAIHGMPLYGESKFIKNGLYAFNISRIEDHQYIALLELSQQLDTALTVVSVGCWKSRSFFYVFFFDIGVIYYMMEHNIKSIKKKQLEALVEADKYMSIKSDKISGIDQILTKIIDTDMYQRICKDG